MKKFFTLFAALMMLSASAETLNLYESDGSTWSYYVPINSMWYDTPGTQTQVLYPAADLTAMVGKEITAVTFYMDEDGNKMNGGVLDLYMGETDATTLTSYLTGLTKVGSVTMTADGATEMTLTFDTPYLYNGGNLVFGNVVVEAGNFTMTYFTCVESGYDNCVTYVSGSPATRQFFPMTTFTYNGGETPEPEFTRGDVDKDGEVGIADVTALIDYILNGNEAGISIEAADCDQDTSVGIADVTALIDFILNGAWS